MDQITIRVAENILRSGMRGDMTVSNESDLNKLVENLRNDHPYIIVVRTGHEAHIRHPNANDILNSYVNTNNSLFSSRYRIVNTTYAIDIVFKAGKYIEVENPLLLAKILDGDNRSTLQLQESTMDNISAIITEYQKHDDVTRKNIIISANQVWKYGAPFAFAFAIISKNGRLMMVDTGDDNGNLTFASVLASVAHGQDPHCGAATVIIQNMLGIPYNHVELKSILKKCMHPYKLILDIDKYLYIMIYIIDFRSSEFKSKDVKLSDIGIINYHNRNQDPLGKTIKKLVPMLVPMAN